MSPWGEMQIRGGDGNFRCIDEEITDAKFLFELRFAVLERLKSSFIIFDNLTTTPT
jgi:hypothetical protein